MKLEPRVIKLETLIESIDETLRRLDTRMEGLDHVIRGNGSPGISEKVTTIQSEIKQLKGDRNQFTGALYGAIGGLTVGLVLFVVQHFFK